MQKSLYRQADLQYVVRLLTASFVSILSAIFICGAKCVESGSGEQMDNKGMLDKDSTANLQSLLLPSVFCYKLLLLLFDAHPF